MESGPGTIAPSNPLRPYRLLGLPHLHRVSLSAKRHAYMLMVAHAHPVYVIDVHELIDLRNKVCCGMRWPNAEGFRKHELLIQRGRWLKRRRLTGCSPMRKSLVCITALGSGRGVTNDIARRTWETGALRIGDLGAEIGSPSALTALKRSASCPRDITGIECLENRR